MSATSPTDVTGRLRRAIPVVVFVALLLVVAVMSLDDASSGLPLDPRSTAADGTKALVLILQGAGARVTVFDSPPTERVDTLLILVDNLDEATAEGVRQHATRGGVLVVTGYGGGLLPRLRPTGATSLLESDLPRDCDVPALRAARRVEVGNAPLFTVPEDAVGCYRRGTLAWLTARELGSGALVTTGGPQWLTNRVIGQRDNAQLAVALLAPRPGAHVGILDPDFTTSAPGDAPQTLGGLIPLWVKAAFLQLLVAFLVLALWRARRLGEPVEEPHAVRLPASDLVIAVGQLLQRTGARDRAAALLRADLRHVLSRRLGGEANPARLADTIASRGADRDAAADVLAGAQPATDQELLDLAQRVEELRRAVLTPTGAPRDDDE